MGIRRGLTWPEQAKKQVVRSGKFWKMNLDKNGIIKQSHRISCALWGG